MTDACLQVEVSPAELQAGSRLVLARWIRPDQTAAAHGEAAGKSHDRASRLVLQRYTRLSHRCGLVRADILSRLY
jgi:hypothetical protein